jgi:hypothetical protein
MNSHRRLRYGAALLGGAPLLLIVGVPGWLALAIGLAGALVVLSALRPGRRGGSGPAL